MSEDLKKKAEELEQTLKMQLSLAKSETGDWARIGGIALAGGITAMVMVKIFGKKKEKKTEKIIRLLEKEGLLDDQIEARLRQRKRSGFLARLGALILPIAISYGQDQLIKKINRTEAGPEHED